MLSARGLGKSFDAKSVFSGVDVDIAPGKMTCLIGPSGTGKTTLLRALALIDPPDKGAISIDGQNWVFPAERGTKQPDPPWPLVTVVFQSLFLWPHMTLRENILLPARNVAGLDSEAELADLIKFFSMENFIDSYPNQASLGQRQRVALARALILKPRYLLLDEITSALDVEQSAKILSRLDRLKDMNTGLLLITHALGFARRVADTILFMDEGRIVESGPPEILDRPKNPRFADFLSLVESVR